MNRKVISVLFLSIALVLAGCAGDGGDTGTATPTEIDDPDETGSDNNGDDAGDGTDGSDDGAGDDSSGDDGASDGMNGGDDGADDGTNGGDDGAGDGSGGDDGAGDGANGDDDDAGDGTNGGDDGAGDGSDSDDWERTDFRTALEEAGSFTSTWTWRSNLDDLQEMTFTSSVNYADERALNSMQIPGEDAVRMDHYYADGVQYTRFSDMEGSDATYYQSQATFDTLSFAWDFAFVYDDSDFQDWTFQGTDTYDGVPVQRYVFDAPRAWLETEQPADSEFDVTSARFELLVDQDGVPRYQLYTVEGVENGQQRWFEWEFTVTGVGSTTVQPPGWVGNVR